MVGPGLLVGLNPNTVTQGYNNKTQVFMQQSMIAVNSQVFCQQEFHLHGKNRVQEFSQQEWARYRCFK